MVTGSTAEMGMKTLTDDSLKPKSIRKKEDIARQKNINGTLINMLGTRIYLFTSFSSFCMRAVVIASPVD